ncbi:hypothetical protein RRG08_024907 [Elysia crispata]|uniref:ETS domain-containing protein n=1 Tax=Elysia crispata TaxID=231223 RepID=A0AAE1DPW0_9GAST|nr:hypothetical protein RRG08_024907 [Elysia crispata]
MSSGPGHDLIEAYQREMKKFMEEQNANGCGEMMQFDQEVPLVRAIDGDFLKTDIKTEEDSIDHHQPQLINFFGMEDVAVSSSIALPPTSWHIPFCSSGASTFSAPDCKDSLNTPTPFCSNAVTGLKWETSVSSSSSSQSPFLSSALLSSTPSISSSSSCQPSSLLLSSSLHRDSFQLQPAPSPTPLPSFTASDSSLDLGQPLPSRICVSPSASSSPASGSFLNDLAFAPSFTMSTTKVRSTITNGLAGSGCTLVSNSDNFMEEAPHQALTEGILEYTDLDKPPFSMYEDFDMNDKQHNNNSIITTTNSSSHGLDDPELLESLHMIHDTLQRDCEELNIPFDPMLWTAEHVQCWVAALCHKKNVPDLSPQLYPMDGPTLCSMPDSAFQQFGESGSHIALEIACCKAAKSVMHQETLPLPTISAFNGGDGLLQASQQSMTSSPCVSPVPSTCSNSQSSSTGFSTPSEHSEDEAYCSSSSSEKRKAGTKSSSANGGGRSIYLWQFLVELLVSDDLTYADCIRWIDQQKGIFKIEDSKKVAFLWGKRKNRPMMNYDKLSRSIRQYYKKGIIKKTEQGRRLVYQFCESTLATVRRSSSK